MDDVTNSIALKSLEGNRRPKKVRSLNEVLGKRVLSNKANSKKNPGTVQYKILSIFNVVHPTKLSDCPFL